MRVMLLLSLVIALTPLRTGVVRAHDFPPPEVTVIVSEAPPGGHPTQQTLIEIPEGPGFDQLTVVAPMGSAIASDAEIPDGTVVGRLDAMATTNAIVRPACDLTVEFTVPLREATTDIDSPQYPAYLRELVPGPHRLRLVADVSPSAEVPVLIETLMDVDEATGAIVTRVVVGNPLDPPPQFRACAPQRSKTTLFGITPDGTALLTSPPVPATPPRPFTYTVTSRPGEDRHRHEQEVTVAAQVGPIDVEPLTPPAPINAPEAPPAPDVMPAATRTRTLVGPEAGHGAVTQVSGHSAVDGLFVAGVAFLIAGLAARRRSPQV